MCGMDKSDQGKPHHGGPWVYAVELVDLKAQCLPWSKNQGNITGQLYASYFGYGLFLQCGRSEEPQPDFFFGVKFGEAR